MAQFEVEQSEGTRWVKVTLNGGTVRAERGAMSRMDGDVAMDVPLPTARAMVASLVSNVSFFRPRYRGTGHVYLESSLGGFHTLQVKAGETWVIENGAYWASDDDISLSVYRERVLTAFWAGEGLLWYQTKVTGRGKVVVVSPGPVEEVEMNDRRLVVDGKYVLARTSGLKLTIARPARGLLGYFLSGESAARVYQGTGRLLMSTTPYWRLRANQNQGMQDPSLALLS
jgi:uncharacterized protein (AIM24 family)